MTIKMVRINGVWAWEVRARDLSLLGSGFDNDFQWAAYAAYNCYMENRADGPIPYSVRR